MTTKCFCIIATTESYGSREGPIYKNISNPEIFSKTIVEKNFKSRNFFQIYISNPEIFFKSTFQIRKYISNPEIYFKSGNIFQIRKYFSNPEIFFKSRFSNRFFTLLVIAVLDTGGTNGERRHACQILFSLWKRILSDGVVLPTMWYSKKKHDERFLEARKQHRRHHQVLL